MELSDHESSGTIKNGEKLKSPQTMELSDHESSGTIKNGEKLKSPQTPQDDHLMENHSTSSPEKPLPISSPTLEKIQSKSGKSMGSMNIDEFLNNAWTAGDEIQISASNGNHAEKEPMSNEKTASLCQKSLSVPTPSSGKTVDQVWAEINPKNANLINHRDHEQNHQVRDFLTNDVPMVQDDQWQTHGEMTLEEFLIKTGVLKKPSVPTDLPMEQSAHGMLGNLNSKPPSGGYFSTNGSGLDINIGIGPVMGVGLMSITNPNTNRIENGNNGLLTNKGSCSMYHMFPLGSGTTSVELNIGGEQPLENGNRKVKKAKRNSAHITLEEAAARRQRRMIRNRESAQRSRARKQAYMAELEVEANSLRFEMESLRFALILKSVKEREEIENDRSAKKKLKTLRRTMSA